MTCLQQRRERIAAIKSDVKKYTEKHDTLRQSISFELVDAKKKQLQSGFDIIDEFAQRLHRKVDFLKSSLKATFEQQAELKWASGTNASLIDDAEKALDTARTARAGLEHEMCRAELEELHLVEGSREMEALADRIANFVRLDVRLPAATDFELRDLNERLNASVAAFEAQVSEKLDELLSRVNEPPRVLRLSQTCAIMKEQLKVQSDKFDPYII